MSKKTIVTSTKVTEDKKLRTKDLIYAGAFGAIYLVLMLIIVMGSGMVPILYIISPLTVGVICGTVYMLCDLKVHKFGAVLILGVLFALVACSGYWLSMVCAALTALAAELILYLGKYKSKAMYVLSFAVFNVTCSHHLNAIILK
ncbi:putative ECF transporter S component (TIGR02185 family) [Aequitasia blattaphilus]